MSKPICVYDFTLSEKTANESEIKKKLREIAKKWCFQLEQGETTDYKHYQGRFSLKMKARLPQAISAFIKGAHLSPTSEENHGNMFYVMKDATRIAGPWDDEEEEIIIPIQVRKMETLYPWQNTIKEFAQTYNDRKVDCIIDTKGNKGKTSFQLYMRCHQLGRMIPFCNDYKDIMRMVMDMPISKAYFIDMPKAINKERLYQLYAGIESIKSGYAYDDRYKFKDRVFDCPRVFVFTNKQPELNLLSIDRWNLWTINDKMELERYTAYEADI